MSSGDRPSLSVSALYIYPIKSLREISIKHATLTPQGLQYDRRFMLREIKEDGSRKNMGCYHVPLMARFVPEFASLDSNGKVNDAIRVSFSPTSQDTENQTEILIPLEPDVSKLKETTIAMHGSPCTGYEVGEQYNEWFTKCFGFDVELIYVGVNRRTVLGNLSPNEQQKESTTSSWMSTITNSLPGISSISSNANEHTENHHEQGLALSDVAAVLVVSQTSLNHVKRLLPSNVSPDIRKFRPNIVIGGSSEEFVEDFWAELSIGEDNKKVLLTQNCNRCVSLNLDFNNGKFADGPEGKVLAGLAKDRRVDPNAKWSPVFGRRC
ncbi:hypothetical protein M409DRAFT_21913 [Zasmidium cellare ATCC 36951]|uniref:MOSC domain-containing protein n=1 Tax=Zasmidium cellare ATCC 36951 TaxID=1080233 RepID=A0A6A6CPF5_ZASCE|nr:uncharacterized protein M409DRAFT_21913 [Zasmidium cellare ATCC 36951]KAF2167762.1 hypothetical protein M409DRAFT_21913 [Zasmidium cellare ATCC 36951]